MKKTHTEPNLMEYYFGAGTRTHDFIADIRKGILAGKMPKFRDTTIEAVREEIDKTRLALDRSTYPFVQDLGHNVLNGEKKRVILLVTGSFYGRGWGIDSVLGFDLGHNPHSLFDKRGHKGTIDSKVSLDMTKEFITENLDAIMERELRGFDVSSSAFFYISNSSLRNFEQDGKINMPALVPLLVSTDYVGLTPVSVPILEEYSASMLTPFTSYRLKASLTNKLLKRLGFAVIPEKRVIRDWASHRIVVATEDEARKWFEYLQSSPRIGTSKIEHLKYQKGATKNYYDQKREASDDSKDTGYKAFHIPVGVSTKGHHTALREIQIMDRGQYYKHEIDPKDSAHHLHQKKKRDHGRPNEVVREAQRVLELAFGQSGFFIEAKSYH